MLFILLLSYITDTSWPDAPPTLDSEQVINDDYNNYYEDSYNYNEKNSYDYEDSYNYNEKNSYDYEDDILQAAIDKRLQKKRILNSKPLSIQYTSDFFNKFPRIPKIH